MKKPAEAKRFGSKTKHLWPDRVFMSGYPLCGVKLPWRLAHDAQPDDRLCPKCDAIQKGKSA